MTSTYSQALSAIDNLDLSELQLLYQEIHNRLNEFSADTLLKPMRAEELEGEMDAALDELDKGEYIDADVMLNQLRDKRRRVS